jgi:hypothetical protein
MIYVECPNRIESDKKSLFLAGGIMGCRIWQKDLVDKLKDLDIVVYNPRRAAFDIKDPSVTVEQIAWEHEHLRKADMISFWFSSETVQPITLYELGSWSMTNKPLAIGVDPRYQRRSDVITQTALVRPLIKIVSNLDDLTDQIFKTINEIQFV